MSRAWPTSPPSVPSASELAGVEQEAEAPAVGIDVDALADRARRVAAAHRQRLEQQVRERVQEHVRPARERRGRACGSPPTLGALRAAARAAARPRPREPRADRGGVEQQEDPFAAVLDRREPARLEREIGALDVALVLAVDVRRDRLEAREADQREHLAQAVELHDRGDRRRSATSDASASRAAGARGSRGRPGRRRRTPRAPRAARRARPA